ncbi:MAG: hypothetical protein EHM17_16400 [Verrucomicrobiaceae bacterium]|nr:MAG: hypothetical protein EHM17_16400 [Verrucomicrobiaceae bacterium]
MNYLWLDPDLQLKLQVAEKEAQSMTLAEAWQLIKDGYSSYKCFHDSEYARQDPEPHDIFADHAIEVIDAFISVNS